LFENLIRLEFMKGT